MTIRTIAEIKALYETGDLPDAQAFIDLIDTLDDVITRNWPAVLAGADGSNLTNLTMPDPLPAVGGQNLTNISLAEYKDLVTAPSYSDSTHFVLTGNQTGYFQITRRIRAQLLGGYHYSEVVSASYDSPSDTTTVEIVDAMADNSISVVGVSAFKPTVNGGALSLSMLGYPVFATTGGTADAYTLTLAGVSATDGYPFFMRIHASNTGASTININGAGTKNLTKVGSALANGDLVANRIYLIVKNTTLDTYEVLSQLPTGGVRSVQVFSASGTWAKPAGINFVKAQIVGGAGGGAGSNGTVGSGGGGGAGGFAEGLIDVTGTDSEIVTIGAGGAGGATTSNGADGGDSSFGALLLATGGLGGLYSATAGAAGGAGGVGSGGDFNVNGADGGRADEGKEGGDGAASFFGGGGVAGFTGAGNAAKVPGAGGGGAGANPASAGGAGSDGVLLLWEYA